MKKRSSVNLYERLDSVGLYFPPTCESCRPGSASQPAPDGAVLMEDRQGGSESRAGVKGRDVVGLLGRKFSAGDVQGGSGWFSQRLLPATTQPQTVGGRSLPASLDRFPTSSAAKSRMSHAPFLEATGHGSGTRPDMYCGATPLRFRSSLGGYRSFLRATSSFA